MLKFSENRFIFIMLIGINLKKKHFRILKLHSLNNPMQKKGDILKTK